jgi:hypothetical protein
VKYAGIGGTNTPATANITSPFSTICDDRTTAKLALVSTEYEVSLPRDADESSKLCDGEDKVYWRDLGSGVGGCREKGIVAVADYTGGDEKMYFS